MTDEELETWVKETSPKVIIYIHESMKDILPGYKYDLKFEDNCIRMNGVDLVPCTIEVKSISGNREVPGFELTTYKTIYGGYWEQDEVDAVPLEQYRSIWEAAKHLVLQVIKEHLGNWQENYAIDQALRDEPASI